MAEAALADDLAEGDGKDKAPAKSKKKLFLYGGGGVGVLVVLAVVYFMFFTGKAVEKPEAAKAVFFDLPEMTVNLSASTERPQYLRVKVTLEMTDSKVLDAVKVSMPRVVDAFQVHLRELRAVDLEGSAGLYRLREELMRRINIAIAPAKIRAVLFKEVVVQ
ncbi:MAG: flagellar basal body-associated FliL family protein [Xanthobacteraceae bacterium]|jgi:flagellar FliL protein|nr:flagellar basal body-associated FliL family protein [Xanthobacteraceae bacterium]